MAKGYPKSRTHGRMILTGAISAVLYAVLIMNQEFIISHWARGGLFAFLPITTAFVFSYFHGSFTGHFWKALGIEASRKKEEVN